ncbi:SPOR domain-containing protein [Thioclava sp. BHET1]|nr:SPOR domain-containing protein [Thioclava sp. BHET1]
MAGIRIGFWGLALGSALTLAGCQAGTQPFGFLKPGPTAADQDATSVKIVDRDVEAPEVFHVKSKGLWDGRPSLGGVWVAYPQVKDPERVIIRNPANGKFVIGALFQRSAQMPGPKLQLSSDAASALGILAGQPTLVDVTALRRQEAPAPKPDAKKPILTKQEGPASKAASAAPSSAKAKTAPPMKPEAAKAAPTKSVVAAPARSADARDYLQIGIFSMEQNAQRAADELRRNGVVPKIIKEESHDKIFWRVVIGPMPTKSDRDAAMAKAKSLHFDDAYFVTK